MLKFLNQILRLSFVSESFLFVFVFVIGGTIEVKPERRFGVLIFAFCRLNLYAKIVAGKLVRVGWCLF